jgi:hypothetical protein
MTIDPNDRTGAAIPPPAGRPPAQEPGSGPGSGGSRTKSLNALLGDLKDILTNVYGIVTVVAAILASFAGGAAVGRATAPPASPKVTASATPSPSVTASQTTPATVTTSPSVTDPSSAPPVPTGITALSALKPVQSNASNFVAGPVQVGTKTYPQSVRFQCYTVNSTAVVYNVAGFAFLDATIGVPNDAANAAGNITVFTFFKDGSTTQLGQPVTDATGRPQKIHLDLRGSAQLEIACSATNATTHNGVAMDVTLADATLTP